MRTEAHAARLLAHAVLLAMEDVKAVLIKLACRVHDMRTCGALPRDRQVNVQQDYLVYGVHAACV